MSSDIQSTFIQPDAASAVSVVAEGQPASFAATLANSSAATASALGNNPFSSSFLIIKLCLIILFVTQV